MAGLAGRAPDDAFTRWLAPFIFVMGLMARAGSCLVERRRERQSAGNVGSSIVAMDGSWLILLELAYYLTSSIEL
jgi:hypothetical protein